MCLAIPGRILSTEERDGSRVARVQFGGITREAVLDCVLVHVGFALSRIDEEEARRTCELLGEIGLNEAPPAPEGDG